MEKDVGSEGVQSFVNTADTVTAPSPGVLSAEHEGKKQIEAAKPVSQLQPEHEEKKQIAAAKSVSQLQTEHEHKKQIEAAKPVSELQLPLVSSSLKHVSPKSRPSPSIDVKDSSPKKQRLCNCNNLRCLKLRHESSKSRSPPNIDVKHSSPKKQRQCNCKFSGCLMLYCECFASGVYCDGCNCTKCCNNTGNEAARHEAIESTLERNPNAFRLKVGLSPHGSCENKEEASEATVLGIHDKESHCKNAGDQSNALFTQQAASKGAMNGAFGISIFGSPPAYKRKCQEINLGTVAKDPSTTKHAQFPAEEASEATVLGIHDKESHCKNAGDQSNALFTQQAASKGAINGAFGISIFGSPPAHKRKCQEINLGTVAKDPSTTKHAQFPAVVSVLGHQMKNNVWCRDPRKKMSSHYRKQPSFEEATLSQPQWLRQQEVFFINLMAEKVTVGGIYRNPGSFWKDEWLDISKRFYELFGLKHDVSYFIKRLNPLQARLTEFKKLVEDNKGLGWDPILKTVIASPEWWEKYIRNHPGAKKFLHQGCPEYEHLSIIFGETIQNRGLAVKADNELESNDRGDALNGGVHVSSHSSIPLHGQSSTPQQCAPPCAPRPSDIPDSSKELVMASHDKEELSEKYSIGECMDILDAMGAEVGERAYMEAVERFRDRDWREIFFRFPTERRKQWLRRLEHRN